MCAPLPVRPTMTFSPPCLLAQDFPKNLPPSARVGFTVVNQVWAAYSPVKNSPADAAAKAAAGDPSHSATTGELDMYMANCKVGGRGWHVLPSVLPSRCCCVLLPPLPACYLLLLALLRWRSACAPSTPASPVPPP